MSKKKIKIATWNVNSIRSRLNIFIQWAQKHQPDFILLQELKCEENKFPFEALETLNYNYALNCQKTYNGVAILSKYPLEDINITIPDDPDPTHARFVEACAQTELGFLRIISLYAPNGGEALSDKYQYKLKFYDQFIKYCQSKRSADELMIIGGDYNIAFNELDVYDAKLLENNTCFTLLERQKLRSLINIGLTDAYRLLNQNNVEYTWWDYRGNSFSNNKGLRIDHILLSPRAIDALDTCYIDSAVREQNLTSDHAPVIAELNIKELYNIFS